MLLAHKYFHNIQSFTHSLSLWIQHFGIPGKMHLHGSVLINADCNLLQGVVPTIWTERFVHVCCCPKNMETTVSM